MRDCFIWSGWWWDSILHVLFVPSSQLPPGSVANGNEQQLPGRHLLMTSTHHTPPPQMSSPPHVSYIRLEGVDSSGHVSVPVSHNVSFIFLSTSAPVHPFLFTNVDNTYMHMYMYMQMYRNYMRHKTRSLNNNIRNITIWVWPVCLQVHCTLCVYIHVCTCGL